VFRGPHEDVAARFRQALAIWPCEWVLRVNADSPVLDPDVLRRVLTARSPNLDLVTTTFPRTFPQGQNSELLNVTTFCALDESALDHDDREHVTRYFYRHADRFRIANVTSHDASLAATSLAVDTVDDLRRIQELALVDRQSEQR
jgi:spore coat polysaccharide biosynthesis protein SpsF